MAKNLIINNCGECNRVNLAGTLCMALQTPVERIGIHPDCPLEEAKDTSALEELVRVQEEYIELLTPMTYKGEPKINESMGRKITELKAQLKGGIE